MYFGKAVIKLAKEETQNGMCLVLIGLGIAYRELGLIWASNNSFVSACSISFKSINEKVVPNKKIYQSIQEIIKNELFIGRIPSLFTWYEMYSILSRTIGIDDSKNDIPFTGLTDGCLSTRILHTDDIYKEEIQYLPDLLDKLELFSSQNTALYILGYIDNIINDYKDKKNEQELDDFFKMVAKQPFVEQMLYQTNFMSEDQLHLSSNILGCKFIIKFSKDTETLLIAETLLAFLEGFFASSMSKLIAHAEKITINLIKNKEDSFTFTYNDLSNVYAVFVRNFNITTENRGFIGESILNLTTDILVRHFIAKDIMHYVENLFKNEEIQERLSLTIEHRNFIFNLLGDTPKLFFDDWIKYLSPNKYISKRKAPIPDTKEDIKKANKQYQKENMDKVRHDEIEIHSVIDVPSWDKAKWKGFGFLFHPQEGLGIILAYENPDAGKKIFDKWINKFGNEDKDELIKITIIKGVDKNHPYWYRVNISTNIDERNLQKSSKLITVASRIHEMNANSPGNLDNLINFFNTTKQYKLYPAKTSNDGKNIEPFFDRGILKTTLTIREAWEIGENDLDRVVIKENDSPIIPEDIEEIPILKIINKAKRHKNT